MTVNSSANATARQSHDGHQPARQTKVRFKFDLTTLPLTTNFPNPLKIQNLSSHLLSVEITDAEGCAFPAEAAYVANECK